MNQKIGLVTGGSRGLGKNAALSMAAKGIDVIITYHTQKEAADSVVTKITTINHKTITLQLNSSNVSTFATFANQIKETLQKQWQRDTFDYLINNAGHGDYALIEQTTEAQFDGLINVHFKGVYFLTQSLLKTIADGGRIVNFSSGLTRMSFPGYAAYAAAKGAVEVLSVYMAKELGSRGIAVNTVAPGAIETDFGGGAVRDNPDINKIFAEMTALGRVGVPDDIGPMIASLISEDNRWVNAQRIEVSGGQAI
jgi:NAD(P)-dependent dehydrogenase (short-subunit alcohol dehydrogenase family)